MTQDNDHITQLLNEASKAPPSPDLRRDIITAALLDINPNVPASPALAKNILASATAHKPQPASAEIIDFTPAVHKKSARKPVRRWLSGNALVGGLMAASLILGIWTGSNGIADNFIAAPLELAGLQASENYDNSDYYNVIDGLAPSESSL